MRSTEEMRYGTMEDDVFTTNLAASKDRTACAVSRVVTMFWLFVAVLCSLLVIGLGSLLARKRTPPDQVRLTINGRYIAQVKTGNTLLHALAQEGIKLPTSCGGSGACAWCKCRVTKGGGRIQDRELPYFALPQVKAHWRLACQVKVVRDMSVEVPEQILGAGPVHGKVIDPAP